MLIDLHFFLSLFLHFRLLDICHGNRSIHERQFTLYLVFEHVEQDLATYLELCPSPGLSPDRIKVSIFTHLNVASAESSFTLAHGRERRSLVLLSPCPLHWLMDV